ncbi:putative lipoprotein [Treponema primitia ZAS-2]|uniref:Putative lipoprotein n=2 Tax=Treponema primitia TaxID=88058 RepID=F5YNQ5_TREPZ|nr:putative lipoprotein [Treponema primitia ZAS-2]
MLKRISFVILAVLILISCENPIQSGLGGKVDIDQPTVSLKSPPIDSFIMGTNVQFEISAWDDMTVSAVYITFKSEDPAQAPIELPASGYSSANGSNYIASLNTETVFGEYYKGRNGDLKVSLRVMDGSGKQVITDDLPYKIKNGAPVIEVQTPIKESESDTDLPKLISGGYLGGVANDDWGIGQGSPKIQFWSANGPEPLDDLWQDMDSEYPADGKKFVNFKYYAIKHPAPVDPSEKPQGLPVGNYRYRLKVWDIGNTHSAVYPLDGSYYEMEVIQPNEYPNIVLSAVPEGEPYRNSGFTIEARLSHSSGIGASTLSVRREGDAQATVLARESYSGNEQVEGSDRLERVLKSFLIEPKKLYNHPEDVEGDRYLQENDLEEGLTSYQFKDGAYEFIVHTVSSQTSESYNSITVYIDTTPPELGITRVIPVTGSTTIGGLTGYTVNGLTAVDINIYDANNFGSDTSGRRELRYLIIPDTLPALDSQADIKALYDTADYFDAPVAPVYKNGDSNASVVIDTRALADEAPDYYKNKDQYLVLMAKDKAGNYNSMTGLLKVEQETDKPVFSISNFDQSTDTKAKLEASSSPNSITADRFVRGVVQDDDGIDPASLSFSYYKEGDPTAHPLSVEKNTVDLKAVSFWVELPLDDGLYSLEMEVKDHGGKKNELRPEALESVLATETINTGRIYFYLDLKAPTLTEVLGDDGLKVKSSGFSLSGTVKDDNGLSKIVVKQQVKDAGTGLVEIGTIPFSPSNTGLQNWALDNLGTQDGEYYYEISAIDRAGNTSILKRTVQVDRVPPKLGGIGAGAAQADISLVAPNISPTDSRIWIGAGANGIQGKVYDAREVSAVFYKIQKAELAAPSTTYAAAPSRAYFDTPANGWTKVIITAEGESDWSKSITPPVDEGLYKLYVAVFDLAGNQNNNWAPAPGYSYTPFVFGVDKAAPDVSTADFYPIPVGGGTALDSGVRLDKGFSLGGTVTDTNELGSITLTQKFEPAAGGGAVTTTVYTQTLSGGSSLLNIPNLPRKTDPAATVPDSPDWSNHSLDGTYTYTLTVKDITGSVAADYNRSSAKTFTAIVDTTGPEVTVRALKTSYSGTGRVYFSPDSLSSNYLLTGEAKDPANGTVKRVYYWDGTAAEYPGTLSPRMDQLEDADGNSIQAVWKSADLNGNSWSINLSLPAGTAEGDRRLKIIAFDDLDHRSEKLSYFNPSGQETNAETELVSFAVSPLSQLYDFPYALDLNPPQLEETEIGTDKKVLLGQKFNLSGKFGDTNSLFSLIIKQRKQDTISNTWDDNFPVITFTATDKNFTPIPIPFPIPLRGEENNWVSQNLPINNSGVYADDSGTYEYTIIATDSVGREAKLTRLVEVDVTLPSVSLATTTRPDNSWYDLTQNIRGTADDRDENNNSGSGVSAVYYWYGPQGSTPPAYDTQITLEDLQTYWRTASGQWSVPLDISDDTFLEGLYTLWVLATDEAGNIGGVKPTELPLKYNFRVDKAAPTVEETLIDPLVTVPYAPTPVTPPSPDPGNKSPLRTGSFDLNIKLHDSYKLKSVKITQTWAGATPAPAIAPPASLILMDDSALSGTDLEIPLTNLPWSAAGNPPTAILVDGKYTYTITVIDGADKPASLTRTIIVDSTPPKVHIIEPDRSAEGSISIRGTAKDDVPGTITQVLYWTDLRENDNYPSSATPVPIPVYPDGTWLAVDSGGSTLEPGATTQWHVTIPLTGTPEGKRQVAVIAVDQLGNVSTPEVYDPGTNTDHVSVRYFSKDDGRPSLFVEDHNPATDAIKSAGFSLKGFVQDTNAIDHITLKQEWTGSGSFPESAPIVVTLILNRYSTSKKQQQYWSFDDLPYSNADTGAFDPVGTEKYKANHGSNNADANNDGIIDSDKSSYGISGYPPIIFTPNALDKYTLDGKFKYTITAYDAAGNDVTLIQNIIIDTTPPTVSPDLITNPAGSPFPYFDGNPIIKGSAVDTGTNKSGIADIYYWIDLATVTPIPAHATKANLTASPWQRANHTVSGGVDSWNLTIDISNLVEGEYQLQVVALDNAGNIGGDSVTPTIPFQYLFGVDKALPEADELTQAADKFVTAGFNLGGTLYDSYGINNLTGVKITQTKDTGPEVTLEDYTGTLTGYTESAVHSSIPSLRPAGTRWWELTGLPRNPSSAGTTLVADGKYTYKITFKDKAGKETTVTRIISVDTEMPTLTIKPANPENPTAEAIYTSSVNITGTASDPSPGTVTAVYTWIGAATDSLATLPLDGSGSVQAGWKLANGTADWNTTYSIGLPNSGKDITSEGRKRLVAYAYDGVGHNSLIKDVFFWVDDSPPELTETAINTDDTKLLNDRFTLSGTATDTNAVKTVEVYQRKLGLAQLDATLRGNLVYQWAGTATSVNWAVPDTIANSGPSLPRKNSTTLADYLLPVNYDKEDGTYIYTIIVTDAAGKTTELIRTVNLDSHAPQLDGDGIVSGGITIASPLVSINYDATHASTWLKGALAGINGSSHDYEPATPGTKTPSGVAELYYLVRESEFDDSSLPDVKNPANILADATQLNLTSGWAKAGETAPWSGSLNLQALGEGVRKLYVVAKDKAGNYSAPATRLFGIDMSAPQLTVTIPDGKITPQPENYSQEVEYVEDNHFQLGGTVRDANLLNNPLYMTITQQYIPSGGIPGEVVPLTNIGNFVTAQDGVDSKLYTWALSPGYRLPRIPTNISSEDPLSSDGQFVYVITLYDAAGNAVALTRKINIDKAGPVVNISSPVQGSNNVGGLLSISGTAIDTNPVTWVYYYIKKVGETYSDSSPDDGTKDLDGIGPSRTGAIRNLVPATNPQKYDYTLTTPSGYWLATEHPGASWNSVVNLSDFGIAEGQLRLWVVAWDGGNWSDEPKKVDFYLDQNPPLIRTNKGASDDVEDLYFSSNVTPAQGANYATSDFSFSFDAWDTNKLKSPKLPSGGTSSAAVKVERFAGSVGADLSDTTAAVVIMTDPSSYITSPPATADKVHVTVNQTVFNGVSGELVDGTYLYRVTITDAVQKTAVLERTLVVDHTPPEVYVTNITPLVGDNADRVNGVIYFNINASDDNGVLGVKYVLLPISEIPPTTWDDVRFSGTILGTGTAATLTAAPYRGVIDTTTIGDNIQYQLCVIARDRAGNIATNNIATNNRIFTVDQSTDKPTILFTGFDSRTAYAPLPNSYRTIDTKDQGYKLTGVISDDDGIKPDTLVLKYTSDGSTWTTVSSATVTVAQVTSGSSREYTFEYEIPKTGLFGSLADGVYSFSAYVEDDPARKSVLDLAGSPIAKTAANNTAYTTFAVDTEAPVLNLDLAFISAPNAPPQTYGTQPVITGTLKEPNLASFKVSVDGGIEYSYVPNQELKLEAADGAGVRAWNFTVPGWTGMAQGPHSLMFVAEDNGRKTTPLGYTFYKDTAGPQINFTNINEDALYIIKSTDADNTQIVYPEATYYGNLPGTADIIADRIAPKLNGSFTDEYSFVFKTGEEQFYYRFDWKGASTAAGDDTGAGNGANDWRVSDPSWIGGSGKSRTWQLPLKKKNDDILDQGYHTVDIMVYDSGNNVNGMTLNGTYNGTAYANTFFQYERVAFRIDSAEPLVTIDVPLLNNTVYGNTTENYYFEADVKVSDYTLSDVSATITGMVTDFYHSTTFIPGTDGGPLNGNFKEKFTKALFTTLTGNVPGVYTFTFTVTATDGNGWVSKDERIFTIDASPPKFELNNLVYPTSSVPTPPDYPTTLIENNPRIQGNVSDESGLKLAQYKLEKWDYSANNWNTIGANYNIWKDLGISVGAKLANWEIKLGTDSGGLGLSDGQYRISFKAEDQALPVANSDLSKAEIVFFIDSKNPVLRLRNPYDTVTTPPYTKLPLFYSGKEAKNSDASKTYVAFYLTATDENTIQSVKGKLDDNNFTTGLVVIGTAPDWANSLPVVPSVNQTGSLVNYWILLEAFNGAVASQISSGDHTIYVEAKDGAGRTTTITREFTFDSEVPVLEINDPYQDKWVESRVIVQGVSSDDNAVADLYYQLGKTETGGNTVWHKYSESITGTMDGNDKTILIGSNSMNNWKFEFPDILDITKIDGALANYVTYNNGSQIYELPMRFKVIDKAGNESTKPMVYATSGATSKTAVDIFKLQINPNGDLPVVTINFPPPNDQDYPNGMEVGGEVSISGLVQDNDWVHSMVYRVKDNDNGEVIVATPGELDDESNGGDNAVGWRSFTPAISPGGFTAWSFSINRDASLSPVGDVDKRSFTVEVMAWDASYSDHGARKQKGLVQTTKVVFVAGQPEYYTDYRVIKDGATYSSAAGGTAPNLSGSFTVKARVRDDEGLSTITWKKESDSSYTNVLVAPNSLDPNTYPTQNTYAVPALEHLKRPEQMVNGRWYIIYYQGTSYNYTTYGAEKNTLGTLFKANFTGTPAVSADTWVVEAVSDAGIHPNDLYTGTGKYYVEYEISLTLNTNDLISLGVAKPYNLSLRVTDGIGTAAVLDIPLKLDRYYPWGSMTGNAVAAGTNYRLVGEAWDSDTGITVQGIDKVVVWFSRNNGTADVPIAIKERAGGIYQAGDTIPVYKGRQVVEGVPSQGSLNNVQLPKLDVPAGSNNVSAIVINSPAETADDDDQDGFIDGISDNGIHNVWYSYLNTTTFNDGLGKVHFVVFDSAGNASYYEYRIFFSNNPPKVTSVTIATDVLGSGNNPDFSDPREYRTITANYETTNITVRNKRLGFKVHIEGEGAPYHYRLYYVSGYAATTTAATALTAGKYYRIETLGDTGWEAVGAPAGFTSGTIFMAIGHAVAGSGTASELNLTLDRFDNTVSQDFIISGVDSYRESDFNTISDVGNNGAKFILKVYNSIKIPMQSDDHPDPYQQVLGEYVYHPLGLYTNLDQPFDVKVIGLNVANADTVKPKVKLWDFNPAGGSANGTNTATPTGIGSNLNRPGLFNPRGSASNIQRSGHIEPRSGNTTASINDSLKSYFIENGQPTKFVRDTLSGSVILRGYAFDEQRIGEVWLKFTSSTGSNEFKILEKDTNYTGTNATRGVLIPVTSGIPASYDTQSNKPYVFNDIDLDGHRAEWAFIWDTESIPASTIIGSDIKVEVIVKDVTSNQNLQRNHLNLGIGGNNDGFSPLTANEGYNRISVDIQPYIQGYTRDSSKGYHTIRSKQGWFTFSRGETVTMNGWNLNTSSIQSVIRFYTADGEVIAATSTRSAHAIVFTVPTTAVTGQIRVTDSAATPNSLTVNDRNNNQNSWNRGGYNPAEPGGELWNDDHAVHIWQSNDTNTGDNRGYFDGSTRPVDPSMTMDPSDGTLWGAWAELSNQALYYAKNNAARTTLWAYNGGGTMDHTDIHMSATRRTTGNTTNRAYPTVFWNITRSYAGTFNTNNSGGIRGSDPAGQSSSWEAGAATSNPHYDPEQVLHNKIIDQFTNPRVVYRGDYMHVSYYDTKDKSMKYWYGKSGSNVTETNYNASANNTLTTNNMGGMRARRWINLDGGSDGDDTSGEDRVRPSTGTGLSRVGAAEGAGEWSAIDLLSDGRPVIAYYDAENQTVRLAIASTVQNPSRNQWTVQYAMNTSDPNYSFSGQYISMQIDQTTNAAHLAFFKSNSTDLIYLKLAWTGTAYTPGTSVIVDDVGAVGRWVDLTLDRDKLPWISYLDITMTDFYDGVKMAYYNPTQFTEDVSDGNGVSQKGWETMAVPALYKIKENRTSIETWPSRDTAAGNNTAQFWKAAIGYTNSDFYRIAYYVKPKN